MYSIIIGLCIVFMAIYFLCKWKQKNNHKDEDIFDMLDSKLKDGEEILESDELAKKFKLNETALLDLKQLYNLHDEVTENHYKEVLEKYK